jgi:hypothetical protein
MSKGASFDDSSNLVEIAAPTNGEQKESAGEISDNQPDLLSFDEPDDIKEDTKSHDSKSKSKKSKAKRLFKRAKSPISGAINKTTKEFKKLSSLPKHHHSSSPKSPQRSPSREKLTEEYSHLEQKLNEKTSEEWLVFQQMQERVKETVAKSQQKLKQYTSQSEDEEPKQNISTKWTGFETDSGLEPEVIDTSLHPSISITCPVNDSDTADLLDSGTDIPNIDTDLGLSPPVTPAPPVNSRIASMDSIAQETEKTKEGLSGKEDELDFFGFTGSGSTSQAENQASSMISQDLLGLESFVSSDTSSGTQQDNQVPPTSDILSGYAFTSSISADTSSAVSTESKTVNSDILMFEQPLETFNKTIENTKTSKVETEARQEDLFVIDDINEPSSEEPTKSNEVKQGKSPLDIFGEPLQPSVVESSKDKVNTDMFDGVKKDKPDVIVSATSVSDEFASFDPMKSESFNVNFSQAVNIRRAPSPMATNEQQYGTSPSQGMTYGSVPVSNIQVDLLSKIKQMSSSSQPVSPARRAAPKPKDVFGFVKKELKKPEDEDDYKPLAALSSKKMNTNEEEVVEEIIADQTDTVNNPFLTSSFTEEMQTQEGFMAVSANAAQLFGIEPESLEIENGFNELGKQAVHKVPENVKTSWVTPGAFDDTDFGTDFESGETWDEGEKLEKKQAGDVWGADEEGPTAETETKASDSDNPFVDDFSKLEDIPIQQQTVDTNANPFLVGDFTDAPLIATSVPSVSASAPSNPFLDTTVGSSELLGGGNSAVLSDSESFFFDSVANNKQDSEVADTDDIFDPFKVNAKSPETNTDTADTASDPLDIFSSVAASGDKQLAKPSDDDHGFMLDIKPVAERPKDSSLPIAPAIAPPPKAPKSPQPPRENPFDRDSPPEENFAQFEVMDASNNEMPKEPPPKSFSTDSATTEEEVVEENLEPLEPFLPECERDSFKLMLRYPTKKKIAGNRYWKNVIVKLETQKEGLMIRVLNDARDQLPIQELPLQPCYSLSDLCLQQYDQYGKIHTVKLQYVFYKERVGIKTERITPSLVKLKKRSDKPKATMILDHSPQVSELLKFGSLDKAEIKLFIQKVEDEFMKMEAKREKTLTYTKDEITAEVRDEYYAELDCNGRVISQKARCRVFCLAFLTGMPVVEMGMNDRRRKGKEVVGRCDIIPIKTEEWIKLENVEFHNCVNREEFENTNNIKFQPLDACQFELMRYRVRLRENKELPLQLTIQQILKQRKCEIRCDLLVTGYHSYSKKHGQFPCEDIEVLFPIPEVWIYMFRYERRFGYGSVHSAARKPGRIKGK